MGNMDREEVGGMNPTARTVLAEWFTLMTQEDGWSRGTSVSLVWFTGEGDGGAWILVRRTEGAARPSFLANIPQPKSNNTEEHERESIDRTDGDSAPPSWGGVLNPEVQDMLHGPVVNDTYLHKVDSDDVTETKDTNFPHNNSTDVVDSPHVEDPGSTHLEEEINDSGNITAGSSANTEDSTNNTSYKSQDVNPPTNDTVVAGQEAQSAASPSQSQSNIVGPIVAELNTTGSGNITASPSTNLSSSDAEVVNANTSAVEHSEAEDSNTANSGVDSEATFNKTRNHPTFLQPSESAGILAGVFVGLALLGYVGLLVWRRILEKRYGNREMLVNEDDFYDTSDLKHFEYHRNGCEPVVETFYKNLAQWTYKICPIPTSWTLFLTVDIQDLSYPILLDLVFNS
uniref:Uncharacterized protein n=1 Tax=Timema tahoe TaxID=61484 RepID=A0A7R9ILQ7_9NEOP|nr:unnamed protein product [Timema tahoe]